MSTYRNKTWWGSEFVNSLEGFIDPGRLQRGRSYRTDNRILSFDMADNIVTAQIRGNINPYFGVYKEPKYNLKLIFSEIPERHWQICIEKICKNPWWLSKLILNEIPKDIQAVFEPFDFLPRSYDTVEASCSCPDYGDPCKHIAGIYYRIAEIIDESPMLLFPLRGMPLDNFHTLLRQSELGRTLSEHLSIPKEISIEYDNTYYPAITKLAKPENISSQAFWGSLEKLEHNQAEEEGSGYQLSGTLLKKQGDYPAFWHRQNSFIGAMESVYQYVKRRHKTSLGLSYSGQHKFPKLTIAEAQRNLR